MKILKLFMVLAALLAVLAACGGNGDGNPQAQDLPQDAQYEDPIVPAEEPAPNEYEADAPALDEQEGDATAEPALAAAIFPFEFETEDLHGNIVTHESMGERELFLLYFWTTWCGACVAAMPGMAELAEEFYGRMGFVSLLGDFETGRQAAINLTENAGAPFFSVDFSLEIFDPLFYFVNSGFVPTSALIDAQGNKIGDMIIGSNINEFRNRINAALGN